MKVTVPQEHTAMTREEIQALAQTPRGRIALHLIAVRLDGRLQWHFDGIMRELRALEKSPIHGSN
jgi:hypothetical protein